MELAQWQFARLEIQLTILSVWGLFKPLIKLTLGDATSSCVSGQQFQDIH
jgi:hypothetical protein